MENEIENTIQNYETEISTYECLTQFRESLLNSIIKSLSIHAESNGLDAGCGIGFVTKLLAETVGENGHVIGLDLSKDFIHYAKNNNQTYNIQFIEGNVNSLQFDDNSFDWLWSVDTIWPGPKELGCPAENPLPIIKEFNRVIKPGGSVFILFWSSQKLLPGYPLLEARLNTTSSATAPFINGMEPKNHILNGRYWLEKVNFKDIIVKTYLGDIIAPLSKNDRHALNILFEMFWGESQSEVSKGDWKDFKRLCDPNSDDYILNNQHYYGFYTYTLFKGTK
ncbi:MAG: class I SAM-dependent methyltransferase [Candidatus Marinimicrobia bacterium]|nr:class I SAM-dependent methyltransferase [Candidatus Neomarinimicrobiota bacterium]